MSGNAGCFNPQGNTVAFSVTGSAHTAVQVSGPGSPISNQQVYYIANSTLTGGVDVFVAMGGPGVTAAVPVDGTPSNSFCVPHGTVQVVEGPPNAYFSMIGISAGPSTVYVTPGDGATH